MARPTARSTQAKEAVTAPLSQGPEDLTSAIAGSAHADAAAATIPLTKPVPPPTMIGQYRILHELGRGGMGVVYLGVSQNDGLNRRVAIKVLKRGMDTEDVLRRFEQERRLLGAMNHPGIARLFGAEETTEGMPYFVMEYVEGMELEAYCDTHRLHLDERLRLFCRVCEAVQHAHQNLIVHRDLKPSNIIVTEDGQPKLLDFGIAKIINPELAMFAGDPTAPEHRVMTPQYASPEQVLGNPVTTASDVYSLGVLLYELVSGHRPYRLRSRMRSDIERVVCSEDPERPSTAISHVVELDPEEAFTTTAGMGDGTRITPDSVCQSREEKPARLRRRLSGDIDNIVLKAMRKEPQRRYVSAAGLAEDITRHLDGLPVNARPDTLRYRTEKFVRRHRAGVAAAVLVSISLVAGLTGTAWGWREAEQAREAEQSQREVAVSERDLAEQRFDHVRSLARTFMFDFHDSIQELDGSLPARKLLVDTALEYLDGLSKEAGDRDDLRREIASAYDRVGDIRGGIRNPSIGDTAGAMENYRTALVMRSELASAKPDDTGVQRELSLSHIRLGDMLMHTGDVTGALDSQHAALRIRETLLEEAPQDAERRRDVAIAQANVGAVLLATGDVPAAVDLYERSLETRRTLAQERPNDDRLQRELSSAELRIGYRIEKAGDQPSAHGRYLEAVRIREAIAERNPDSSRAKRDLAIGHYYVGRSHLALDEPESAAEHLEHYLVATTERVADNPESARAKRDLATAHEMMGVMHVARGDWEPAAESFREFRSVIEPLSRADPTNVQYRTLLATSIEHLGGTQAAQGDTTGAVESGRQALSIIEPLAKADGSDVRTQADYARILTRLGSWLADDDKPKLARRRLDAAWSKYRALAKVQPDDVTIRTDSVTALQELSSLMVAQNDGQAALAYAERALDLTDDPSSQFLRDVAVTHHMTGDTRRAIEVATDALKRLGAKTDEASATLRRTLEEDLKRYRGE